MQRPALDFSILSLAFVYYDKYSSRRAALVNILRIPKKSSRKTLRSWNHAFANHIVFTAQINPCSTTSVLTRTQICMGWVAHQDPLCRDFCPSRYSIRRPAIHSLSAKSCSARTNVKLGRPLLPMNTARWTLYSQMVAWLVWVEASRCIDGGVGSIL